MKKWVLCLVLLFMTSLAYADVTAEIVGKAIDDNGNIIIRTQYKIDGVEVVSRYPKDEQGRYYWVTRYNIINFAGMTKAQIKQRVGRDIKAFAQNLIRQEYLKKANLALDTSDVIGQTLTETTAEILVDTDGDGIPDKKWTVKNDGSKVESDYTPVIP